MITDLNEFLNILQPVDSFRLFRYTEESQKSKSYHQVALEKRGGGIRFLQVPNKHLKRIQRRLLPYFQHAEISPCAAAYIKGKTVLDHAQQHTNSKLIVKLDIEDFFGSTGFWKVFRAVDTALSKSTQIGPEGSAFDLSEGQNYNGKMSWFIANVCTLDGVLPQGAPTSPMLSNMVFYPLDNTINNYCMKRKITYSRYSDDMTFSGDFNPAGLIDFVRNLMLYNGYFLNERKTVIAGSGRQQKITGVVVNERPQTERRYRRKIRQEIYYIGKFGLEKHLRNEGLLDLEEPDMALMVKELQKLIGRIAFVLQIDPENKEFLEYKESCVHLLNQVPVIWNDHCGPEY